MCSVVFLALLRSYRYRLYAVRATLGGIVITGVSYIETVRAASRGVKV
tara:strand:- start:289 stop:432 length:144 start_codon:yes stop_codon:yes gene_type:complete